MVSLFWFVYAFCIMHLLKPSSSAFGIRRILGKSMVPDLQLHGRNLSNLNVTKFNGNVVHLTIPGEEACDVYLCGTVHVAKNSVAMVKEVIDCIRPNMIVLELCENRIDSVLSAVVPER